jgi:cysteine sulfinate desulfinase/cysteine desulfurase-like protein
MIAGLGEAAKLVCDNLSEYCRHMEKIRDYLEEKLKVCQSPTLKYESSHKFLF